MYQHLRRLLAVLGLMLCCLLSRADASNLTKADIERMVDYFYVVGEILPDLPVYPLFVKDTGGADAKPELKAYVFESIDFAPARGYSGKPINLLIIKDDSGNI
jgi:transcriptional regulator of nitric oxide reductase